MKNESIRHGAPPSRVAPLLLALALLAPTLYADALADAKAALSKGEASAAALATEALKANPEGASENALVALAMFRASQFDDAARYMRRAVHLDAKIIDSLEPLNELVPSPNAQIRRLAESAADSAELCFLTGALLLMSRDRAQALPFLIRAEELAGTDAQAAALAGSVINRSRERGIAALREGNWLDARRAFAFSALDTQANAADYAGMALALACLGDDDLASRMLAKSLEEYEPQELLAWLAELSLPPAEPAAKARNLLDVDPRPQAANARLAAVLALSSGFYATAGEALVAALDSDRLDRFSLDLRYFMEQQSLAGDPAMREQAAPEVETTLDDVRRLVARGDFASALEAIEPHVDDGAAPEVLHLLFVVLVGTDELTNATAALWAWVSRPGEDRLRANAVRELFETEDAFTAWHKRILDARSADPNAAPPRLLNGYVEATRSRFQEARSELAIALIAEPGNPLAAALGAILPKEAPPEEVEVPPEALREQANRMFREGNFEGARSSLLRAAEAKADLPRVHEALLRCHFALGDYSAANRTLIHVLDAQQIATENPTKFNIAIEDGYADAAVFEQHLAALRDACRDRPLAAELFLLHGAIEFDRTNWVDAATALQTWFDLETGSRNEAALRLLEHARKQPR